MATTGPSSSRTRPTRAARRFGYLVAVVVDVVIWYVVNVRPGWRSVAFLTEDTEQVLGLFNLSLAASAAANLCYLAFDARWVKAAWELVLAAIGLALSVRVYEVFPFDFSGATYDWTTVARVLVVVGIVGSAIGLVTGIVKFAREIFRALARRAD
jgi:hypothetical protein